MKTLFGQTLRLVLVALILGFSAQGAAQKNKKAEEIPPPPEGLVTEEPEQIEDPLALENLMKEVLQVYLEMHSYLAEDSIWRVSRSAGLIALKTKHFNLKLVPREFSPMYRKIPKLLRVSARKVYKAKSLADLRLAFKDLSRPMTTWANLSKPVGIDVIYCPVANATWLQNKGPIRNPYYGSQMLTSGQIVWAGPEIATEESDGDASPK